MTELPDYADLPPVPGGGRSGWGLFGAGDNLGLVNLMTPARIAAAARLVRRGQIFCLDMPLGSVSPALAMFRGAPRHHILHQPGTAGFDDVYDNFYPQASSQWDSLAHVGYAPDQMYNGATEQEVLAGTRNTIDHWARHGLAGRAVLLDVERAMREAGQPHDPGGSSAIGVAAWNWPVARPASSSRPATSSCCTPASPPGTSASPARSSSGCTATPPRPASSTARQSASTCGTATRRPSRRTPTAWRSFPPT